MDICSFIVASVNFCVKLFTQRIMQHPIAVKTSAAIMRMVIIEASIPFHFLNHSDGSSEWIINSSILCQLIG